MDIFGALSTCRLHFVVLVLVAGGLSCSTPRSGAEGDDRADDDRQESEETVFGPDNMLVRPSKPRVPEAVRDKSGGRLRRALSSEYRGFNWHLENTTTVTELQSYVLGAFAFRDLEEPREWVPAIAEKVTRNEDYTEYTIHLREGIYWQKPNVDLSKEKYQWMDEKFEVTAEDCVFSFRMVTNDKVEAGASKNYFRDLERVEKIDKYTCKVVWKEKTSQSVSQTLGWYPLPKWLYTRTQSGETIPEDRIAVYFNNHWANRHAVGVGPYEVAEYEPGGRLVLKRDADYYGADPPIETIEYEVVKRPKERLLRLDSGSLDFAELAPPQYRKYIEEADSSSPFGDGTLEYEVVDEFAYYYIGWNSEKPLFDDVEVRRALTHALDREGIIENQLYGLGEVQTGPFYHDHEAVDPTVEPYEYNLERARSLLEEAGWKDRDGDGIREKEIDGQTREFEFSLLAYNKPTTRRYISVYKDDLRSIGVDMQPKPVDWATMQKRMNEKNFDAYTGGWALSWYVDPYQIWHSSQAEVPRGSNRVGFKNDRADEIIETLRGTLDEEKRTELLREFHKIVHEKQPYTFFYAPKGIYAWRPRVKNVQFQKMRPQDLSLPWWIEEES